VVGAQGCRRVYEAQVMHGLHEGTYRIGIVLIKSMARMLIKANKILGVGCTILYLDGYRS